MAMTVGEAAAVLKRMYRDAPAGEKGPCLILFGIKYVDDLARLSLRSVIRESGLHRSADVQIRHGMKLEKYVQIRPDAVLP